MVYVCRAAIGHPTCNFYRTLQGPMPSSAHFCDYASHYRFLNVGADDSVRPANGTAEKRNASARS